MQASKNSVVSFHYNLSNEAGEIIESSRDGEPSLFLFGADNVLPGVESAIAGKSVGDTLSVTLAPHAAYGIRDDSKKDRIPAKYLKHEGKLKPGQTVRINTNKGTQVATVIKVGKFSVDIDSNHPLAGQTVTFDIEVMAIREASSDEVAHGHAHGVGGHQH